GYAAQLVASDDDIDQWALTTLRFIQYQQLNVKLMPEMSCIPAYTREGYERVQSLRLTAAEAQFASQFNGARSIQQITKNLRLDIKFARLTLFRFLALEIVGGGPGEAADKVESRSGIRGIFGRELRFAGQEFRFERVSNPPVRLNIVRATERRID